jgi:hypothetical protein
MNNSCVGSPDRQTRLSHLEAFFCSFGLAISLEKCVFAVPTAEYLGHTISAAGLTPTAENAAAIEACPAPQDIKQLQHFLDMVNFYHHFLPNCAKVLHPLTDLLSGSPKSLQ